MKTERIELGERSYDICIGAGILDTLGKRVRDLVQPSRAIIVSDSNVAPLYADRVAHSLQNAGIDSAVLSFPAGEDSKTLAQLGTLCEQMLDHRLDRKGVVIALGGGVTGDLAGFAAASFMRGVRFVQVPTSLLAMVDSSSGGKTGVNLPRGKNMVGAFHQPSLVWIDTTVLETLPRRELGCGLGEIVKHGIIRDRAYFDYVSDHADAILALDHDVLAETIHGSCRIKGEIVSADEREAGCRALLNFGHTFGHAYESLSRYAIPHGEAVAMGMVAACHAAERILGASPDLRAEVTDILKRLDLPPCAPDYAPGEVLASMFGDKKTEGGTLRLVLSVRIGEAQVCEISDTAPVQKAIQAARETS